MAVKVATGSTSDLPSQLAIVHSTAPDEASLLGEIDGAFSVFDGLSFPVSVIGVGLWRHNLADKC